MTRWGILSPDPTCCKGFACCSHAERYTCMVSQGRARSGATLANTVMLSCAQIIAVHADDPEFKGFDDISQLPKHRLAEIRRCEAPQKSLECPRGCMSCVARHTSSCMGAQGGDQRLPCS